LLLAAMAATQVAAQSAPQAVTADYNVYMNGAQVAVMKESFEAREQSYRIVSESVPIGIAALLQRPATATSLGQLTAEGLRPERFEGRRPNGQPVKAEFDWRGAQLTYTHEGKSETVPLEQGTQDRLSVMYQFMFYTYHKRDRIDVAMTDGRRLAHYQYSVTPNVEIDTPLGKLATIHLVKKSDDASGTEVWLAPQHHFLPVKMLIRENNGTRYEQVVTRIDAKGAVVSRR
jgi:hypothetical protein